MASTAKLQPRAAEWVAGGDDSGLFHPALTAERSTLYATHAEGGVNSRHHHPDVALETEITPEGRGTAAPTAALSFSYCIPNSSWWK
jgi:CelD/BcsL family acetyltransferase involved in cellulose biosynthesis